MNSSELLQIFNQAGEEDLIALPGVGPVLAERLMQARPFDSLDAALAVKGMGRVLLDNLLGGGTAPPHEAPAPGRRSLDTAAAESAVEEIREAVVEKGKAAQKVIGAGLADVSEYVREGVSEIGEAIGKGSQAAYKAVEDLPEKFEQASKARGPLWTILVSSAITALIAIVLCLLILASINGSLKFATAAQARGMQQDLSKMAAQVNDMQQELSGLRTRINTLEGLGERTIALEKAQQQISTDVEEAVRQVTAMQDKVTALNEKVDQQEERSVRFDTFLKDLQALLGRLMPSQGGTQ